MSYCFETVESNEERELKKGGKKSKDDKKGKKGKKGKSIKKDDACVLPKLTDEMTGKPHWVQGGQVMTFFVQTGTNPAKTYTDERPTIANNDQYVVKCREPGYVPDEMCVYTCTNGVLDHSSYCQANPEDICVKAEDMTIAKQCMLDFDSDEPWHDGKSLKAWWQEVLDKFYFPREDIFNRKSEIPFLLGHGAATLAGAGFVVQHFGGPPPPDTGLNADLVDLTGWVNAEEYEYGVDTLRGSTSAPQKSYLQNLVTESIPLGGPFFLPNVTGPIPDYKPKLVLVAVLRPYDPCDDSKYFGFSPECFTYHPAGYHTGSGEMINFRTPLSNGKIDLLGHCTEAETYPPTLINALVTNFDNVASTIEVAGGLTNLHPASYTLHLCVDDDIYHPYLCTEHPNLPDLGNGADYVPVNTAPFMPIPTKMRQKLCADRIAAGPDFCKPTNDTNYPYPWTQFA